MAENKVTIVLDAQGSEAVAKVFNDLAAKGKQFAQNITTGAKGAQEAVSGLGASARTVFEIFTGVSLGNIFVSAIQGVKDLTQEMFKLGIETHRQEESFRAVAHAAGVSAEEIEKALEKASDGLADFSDVANVSARALQNAMSGEQLKSLMEVARAQAILAGKDVSTAFNEIAAAATNQQARALKAYGITIDVAKANEEYAKSLGVSEKALTKAGEQQAFVNAIIAQTKGKLVEQDSAILKQIDNMTRWQVAWQNTKEGIAKNLVDMTFGIVDFVKTAIGELDKFIEWLKNNQWTKWLMIDDETFNRTSGRTAEWAAAQKKALQGGAGEAGPGGPSPEQLRKMQSFGASAKDAADKVDFLKNAMIRAEEAQKLLKAQMDAGIITQVEYAAGLERTIAASAGLAKGNEEQRLKYIELQAALKQVNETMMRDVVGAFKALGEEVQSAGLDDFEQKLLKVNNAIDENALLTEAQRKNFKAVAEEMANMAFQADSLKKIQAEDAKIWTDLNAAMEKNAQTLKLTGDEEAALKANITAMQEALVKARTAFGDADERALDFENRLKALTKGLETYLSKQKEMNDALDIMAAKIQIQSDDAKETTEFWNAHTRALAANAKMEQVVGISYDATSVKIRLQQQAVEQLAKEYGPLSEQVREAVHEFQQLQNQKFGEELAAIGVQANLLGDNFDALGATISLFQERLKGLSSIKIQTPELQAEIRATADAINQMIDQKRVDDMLSKFRDSFGNALNFVRNTIESVQSTISDFFQVIGRGLTGQIKSWKDFGTEIANVLKSFVNTSIKNISDFAAQSIVGGLLGKSTAGQDALSKAAAQVASTMNDKLVPAANTTGTALTNELTPAVTSTANAMTNVLQPAISALAAKMGQTPSGPGGVGPLGEATNDTVKSFTDLTNATVDVIDVWGPMATSAGNFSGVLADTSPDLVALGMAADKAGTGVLLSSGMASQGLGATANAAAVNANVMNNALAPASVNAAKSLNAIPGVVGQISRLLGGGGGGAGGGGGGVGSILGALGLGGGGGMNFAGIVDLGKTIMNVGSSLLDFGSGLGIAIGNLTGFTEVLGPAATGIQVLDMAQAGASISQITGALQAAQPAISGFGTLLAGVGAAMAVFSGVMSLVNGQIATGVGTLSGVAVGAVAGAVVGSIFPGIGTLAGGLIGAGIGGALGGIIGGLFEDIPTEYEIKRIMAQNIASAGIGALTSTYQKAARSQNIEEVQAALAGRQGQVYTILQLPKAIADSLGILGAKIADNLVQVDWSALTRDQFTKLLAMFKANPDLAKTVVMGSADVPYLEGGDAATNAGRIKDASLALISAFNAIGQYVSNVNKLASTLETAAKMELPPDFSGAIKSGLIDPLKAGMLALLDAELSTEDLTKALDRFQEQAKVTADLITFTAQALAQNQAIRQTAQVSLPPDLAANVISTLIDPFKAQMKAALQSGLDPALIAKQMEEIQKQQAAIGGLVSAYDTLGQELATMSGDLDTITERAIAGYKATAAVLEENVATAMQALADAPTTISPEEELALINAAHKAVIDRYQAEMDAIQAIEKQIATTLQKYGTPLNNLTTSVGLFEIETKGTATTMGDLIASMTTIALTTKSSSEAVWAFNQAMTAIIKTGSAISTQVGQSWNFNDWASQAMSQVNMGVVVQAMYDQAAPLLAKIQTDVNKAVAEGNLTGALDLLNQMADAAIALAQGAVAAVNAWAEAAIRGVNEAADAQIKAVNEVAKARTDALEAELKPIEAQQKANDKLLKQLNKDMDGIQKAADKQISANERIIEGLNDQIDTINKVAETQIKANQKIMDGLNDQIAAIEKEAASRVKANEITIRGLNAQIKGIEDLYGPQIKANDTIIKGLERQVKEYQKIADAQIKVNDAAIRGLEKQIAGIQKVSDAQIKLNTQTINGLTKQIAAAEKIAEAQIKANDAALKIIEDQIDAIQKAADLQRDANDAEIDVLRERQDALNEALDTSREWSRVLESLKKQITDLLLGPQAPLNPMAQLEIARDAYERALAGATTPAGVEAAQAAAQDFLKAAGGVFARPSLEYQKIFNQVVGQLQGLQGVAEGGAGDVSSLEAELASVTAQLKALEEANKALEKATRDQLDPLRAQAEALRDASETIRDALEEQVGPMKEQVDALQELNDTLKEQADALIEPLREQADALKELNDTLKDQLEATIGPMQEQIDALKDLNDGLRDLADSLIEPLKDQVDSLQELNETIRQDAEDRIGPMKEQVDALNDLNKGIREVADSAIEPLKTQVEDLTQTNKELKRATDDLLQPIKDQITTLEDNNDALADSAAAIREQITAINTDRDAQVKAIEESRTLQIQAIKDSAKAQIDFINQGLSGTLQNIAAQERPIYEAIRDKEDAVRDAITGGLPTQDAIRNATAWAEDHLRIIKDDLHAFLVAASTPTQASTGGGGGGGGGGGAPIIDIYTHNAPGFINAVYATNAAHPGQSWPALVSNAVQAAYAAGNQILWTQAELATAALAFAMTPTELQALMLLAKPGWMPTGQHGIWRTKEGPHYLHADERVLTRAQADLSRSGAPGVQLNITVNVEGQGDEEVIRRAVRAAVAETETSARIGRLNRIIQEQVR